MSRPAPLGYDPAFFDALARVEDRHAWFRVRNRTVAEVIAQLGAGRPGLGVLEVGCGSGAVLAAVAAACPAAEVVGMDLFPEALAHARVRTGAPLAAGDAMRPPFGPVFDVVGMFDVLEHLPDDVGALRAQRALLAPGGALALTVPADPALWSYFDEASRHVRRYTEASLAAALRAAGFEVEYLTPMMAALRPLLAAWRRVGAARARDGSGTTAAAAARQDLHVIPVINGVMESVLGRERPRILRRERISAGTSLLAIARPATPPGRRP